MGHGAYSGEVHRSTTMKRLAEGTDFSYSRDTYAKPRSEWKVNELLDPKRENQKGDHAGTIIRESLDFEDHPNTTPIIVAFDVTGSMSRVPRVIVQELPKLIQALLDAGVPDPQVLIAAIGDAYSDTMPLQVGQFESDNRIDEQIDKIVLEGGGGGGNHESYELAAYMFANYTHLDSLELRGKKGFCFFIADERVFKTVNGDQVKKHIGIGLPDQKEGVLDTKDVFADLQEKFQTYLLMSEHGGYTRADTVDTDAKGQYQWDNQGVKWDQLLPAEQILVMKDATELTDRIAQIIKVREGERLEV
jgi:hypothetical protein